MLKRSCLIPRTLVSLLLLALICIICLGFGWKNDALAIVKTYTDDFVYNSHSQVSIAKSLENTLRGKFIASALETTLPSESDFNASSIQTICSDHSWTNDVIFKCDKIIGGISNVRQELLTCIRWAIEPGVSLILPSVRPRLDTNSTLSQEVRNAYTSTASLGHFFDTELSLSRIRRSCPQLTIYEDIKVLPLYMQIESVGVLNKRYGFSKQQIRDEAVKFISERRGGIGNMSLVTFDRSLSDYEVCNDGIDFANTFGQLLTFRGDVRRLAAVVLYELSNKFALNLDPFQAINKNGFLGLHLRAESDSIKAGWLSYEGQPELYLHYVAKSKLRTTYIASGNFSSIAFFTKSVAP